MTRKAAIAGAVTAILLLPGCIDAAALLWSEPGPGLPAALLRPDTYPEVVVEVHHAAGREPCPAALGALLSTLEQVTQKPVRLAGPERMPSTGASLDNGRLVDLHRAHAQNGPVERHQHGSGSAAHLHILYVDGVVQSASGGHAAGRTIHDYGVIVMFRDAYDGAHIFQNGVRRDATCDVERTVLLHELGHAVGLVDRGVPMQTDRVHPDHPGHSANPKSVLYPVLRLGHDRMVLQELPRSFDADDLADLAAYRDG